MRGTVSLLQHSLYGLTNTTRGVMSSLAKGLTSLSMQDGRGRSTSAAAPRQRPPLSRPLLSYFHSQSVSAVGGGLRTALSFASSAVDLVSSAADALSAAVNPQAKVQRVRAAPLFELGLFPTQRSAGFLQLMSAYLREHPTQSFYCSVQQTPPLQATRAATGSRRRWSPWCCSPPACWCCTRRACSRRPRCPW